MGSSNSGNLEGGIICSNFGEVGFGAAGPDPQTVTNSGSSKLEGTMQLSNITPIAQSGQYTCIYANFAVLAAKYGGTQTEKEIQQIAEVFLMAGPKGPKAAQIPYLAAMLGFKSNTIWDDGSKTNPKNELAVWNSLKADKAVMIVTVNNNGEQHDRTIVKMEYWTDRSAGTMEFRNYVMDPGPGTMSNPEITIQD